MEDLWEIYKKVEIGERILEEMNQEFIVKLRAILHGPVAVIESSTTVGSILIAADEPFASPQQTKKRYKRLAVIADDDEDVEPNSPPNNNKKQSAGNSQISNVADIVCEEMDSCPIPLPAPRSNIAIKNDPEEALVETQDLHSLMPPPPAPSPGNPNDQSSRPQRAAKLKSEKLLKEPSLSSKLRRPSNLDSATIKLEHEQRQSQVNGAAAVSRENIKSSLPSTKSDDSILIVRAKTPTIVEICSEDECEIQKETTQNSKEASVNAPGDLSASGRHLRVLVKREKLSIANDSPKLVPESLSEPIIQIADIGPMPLKMPIKNDSERSDSTMTNSILSATNTSAAPAKKTRKKKGVVHKPIKVERFSDLAVQPSPIASRTRKGSFELSNKAKAPQHRAASIYEDAVDNLTSEVDGKQHKAMASAKNASQVSAATPRNETITVAVGKGNATMVIEGVPCDATFCTNPAQTTFQVAAGQTTFIAENQNPNATVTLQKKVGAADGIQGDVTFDIVPSKDNAEDTLSTTKQSMETAKDTSHPQDSLITEDDCLEPPIELPPPKTPVVSKLPTSAKAYKMPTRTKELFNPLIQSPVKKKVEAFENVSAKAEPPRRGGRVKVTKENATHLSSQPNSITPLIGKLQVGRYLTPVQSTNTTPTTVGQLKKTACSASKAMPYLKGYTAGASNLKSTSSTSSKTLSRENSADEVRKGIQKLADERKKEREQKHKHAAELRDQKDRERAERTAKLVKEREEKRAKKQLEADQKKRELEEIQRKLLLQEKAEAAKQKAAKAKAIADQERDLLVQMQKKQQAAKLMLPPKVQSKYTFQMLHEDDSTDDEGKTSYKRPPPPLWSRSHVRGMDMLRVEYCPTDIIDSFFSVQPLTPDLRIIFPNIDARYLRRNSSVLWSTPPRYSELPKY